MTLEPKSPIGLPYQPMGDLSEKAKLLGKIVTPKKSKSSRENAKKATAARKKK